MFSFFSFKFRMCLTVVYAGPSRYSLYQKSRFLKVIHYHVRELKYEPCAHSVASTIFWEMFY